MSKSVSIAPWSFPGSARTPVGFHDACGRDPRTVRLLLGHSWRWAPARFSGKTLWALERCTWVANLNFEARFPTVSSKCEWHDHRRGKTDCSPQAIAESQVPCDVRHLPSMIQSTSRRSKNAKHLEQGSQQSGQDFKIRSRRRTVASGDCGLGAGRACCRIAQALQSKGGSTRRVDRSINTYVSASRGAR